MERFPAEGKSYPLQYSGLENSMDCIAPGVTKSQTQLSNFHKSNEFLIKRLARKVSCSAYMFFLRSRKRIYHLGQTDVNESLVDSRACVWTKLVFGMCPLPALAPCPTFIFRLHAVQPNHGPLVL